MKTSAPFVIVRRLTAAALVAFVLGGTAGAQERLAIRGTSVTLTPPPGFTPARSARGIDGTIPFAIGQQAASGKTVTKYFGLVQGDKTVLVTFTIPDRSFTETDAEAVLRSIEIAPEPTLEERLESIPFTFRAVEPYSVADIVPRQAVTLRVDGDGVQPVVVIGYGRSQALMGEEARVAVELLRGTSGYRDAQITAQGPTAFAGGSGYVVTAVVEQRTVIQYLRIIPGGGYLRFLARGETTAVQGAEPVLTEIAGSVEPR